MLDTVMTGKVKKTGVKAKAFDARTREICTINRHQRG